MYTLQSIAKTIHGNKSNRGLQVNRILIIAWLVELVIRITKLSKVLRNEETNAPSCVNVFCQYGTQCVRLFNRMRRTVVPGQVEREVDARYLQS